jgi:hypothetical protein
MPNRYLREGILGSPRVNSLSIGAELMYRRLMSVVDDYGRFYGVPGTIRVSCWPTNPDRFTEEEVSGWLKECTKGHNPLIRVYEVAGIRYLELTDFRQFLRSKSRFPANPATPTNGAKPKAQPEAALFQMEEVEGFKDWWELWSSVRGTNHHNQAEVAYKNLITPENRPALFECTQSYLASLDNPNKGYNPETFITEQSKDEFRARWPASRKREKQTPLQQAIAASKKEVSHG